MTLSHFSISYGFEEHFYFSYSFLSALIFSRYIILFFRISLNHIWGLAFEIFNDKIALID